jgi:hypothetical protein
MRITVDIPDVLYRQLRAKAAREKLSIEKLILRDLESEVYPQSEKKEHRVTLPLIRSRRLGSLNIDNGKIYDLISFP